MGNILNTRAKNPTTAVFGTDTEGHTVIKDVSSAPHLLIAGTTGCHAAGDRIVMADGSLKPVELINGGDRVMGDDGHARLVLMPRDGYDEMYEVTTKDREPMHVNGAHNLLLWDTARKGQVEMTVRQYLDMPASEQSKMRLCVFDKVMEFEGWDDDSKRPIDPYILGVLLGDGGLGHGPSVTTMDPEVVDAVYAFAAEHGFKIRVEEKTNASNKAKTYHIVETFGKGTNGAGHPDSGDIGDGHGHNRLKNWLRELGLQGLTDGDKFVPDAYKFAPPEVRMQVIAGIIDTDGYLNHETEYDFVTKSSRLANDLWFMLMSVGIPASKRDVVKTIKSIGFSGNYVRLCITGDIAKIPVRVACRKTNFVPRQNRKMHPKFEIRKISDRERYYGFTCDGNHKYILNNGIINLNSGKSVYINAILVSMMYHSTPDELRITWIDPKAVEATAYRGLPYCPIDPVTKMGDAYGLLAYLVWEMKKRYAMLKWLDVKNIDEYNEKADSMTDAAFAKAVRKAVGDSDEDRDSAEAFDAYKRVKMRYWVVVIDEYANLSTEAHEAEELIKTLAAMSRACGIHLIISTQRPSVDVISGTLKSNIPSRIALMVANSTNSSIILDHDGAEKLLGHGDSIVAFAGSDEVRCQGVYITNDEIESIFAFLRKRYKPAYVDVDDASKYLGNVVPDGVEVSDPELKKNLDEYAAERDKAQAKGKMLEPMGHHVPLSLDPYIGTKEVSGDPQAADPELRVKHPMSEDVMRSVKKARVGMGDDMQQSSEALASDIGVPYVDDSESFMVLPDGTRRIDYMRVVVDPVQCGFAGYRDPMCSWVDDEQIGRNPWDRHVGMPKRGRRF